MKRKIFYINENELTNIELHLIEWIESNANLFTYTKMEHLSEITHVSIASISKMSKKMGFKNYGEMQKWVLQEYLKEQEIPFIENPSHTIDSLNNVAHYYIGSIKKTISHIDSKKINKIKNSIKNKKSYIFGIDSSDLASRELSRNLLILNFSAIYITNIHILFSLINQKNKNESSIIIFSISFSSIELVTIRKIANENDISLILITSNFSLIENTNEIILKFKIVEQEENIIAFSSKISQLLISDCLIYLLQDKTENEIYNSFAKIWTK